MILISFRRSFLLKPPLGADCADAYRHVRHAGAALVLHHSAYAKPISPSLRTGSALPPYHWRTYLQLVSFRTAGRRQPDLLRAARQFAAAPMHPLACCCVLLFTWGDFMLSRAGRQSLAGTGHR